MRSRLNNPHLKQISPLHSYKEGGNNKKEGTGGEVGAPRNAYFGNPMTFEFKKERKQEIIFVHSTAGLPLYTLGGNYSQVKIKN